MVTSSARPAAAASVRPATTPMSLRILILDPFGAAEDSESVSEETLVTTGGPPTAADLLFDQRSRRLLGALAWIVRRVDVGQREGAHAMYLHGRRGLRHRVVPHLRRQERIASGRQFLHRGLV